MDAARAAGAFPILKGTLSSRRRDGDGDHRAALSNPQRNFIFVSVAAPSAGDNGVFPILKGTLSSACPCRAPPISISFQSSKELYLPGKEMVTITYFSAFPILKGTLSSDECRLQLTSPRSFPILKGTLSSPKNIAIATIFMVHHLPLHLI